VPSAGGQGSAALAEPSQLPECIRDGIVAAAKAHGVDVGSIDGTEAQRIVNEAASLADVGGRKIDVRHASTLLRSAITRSPQSAAAAALIRNALMRSRSGHSGIEKGMSRGRCDNGSLYRIAHNHPRLFHRRHAPDPGRYLVWLMVDRSGSMEGQPTQDVIAMTKALASASKHTPSMRMAVFGWTTPNMSYGSYNVAKLADAGAYRVWESGQSVDEIDNLRKIRAGGTPDSMVFEWASRAAQHEATPGEVPVVVMLSDGQGYGDLDEKVAAARRRGVRVISVAIGEYVTEDYQRTVYGRGEYVTWRGDIVSTARPLAEMLGRLVAA
jgi:hypothetical protein